MQEDGVQLRIGKHNQSIFYYSLKTVMSIVTEFHSSIIVVVNIIHRYKLYYFVSNHGKNVKSATLTYKISCVHDNAFIKNNNDTHFFFFLQAF